MRFETKLNSGDKLKIGVVLFFGILALLGWYVIRPMVNSINDLDDKIVEAKQTKQLYFYKVTNIAAAEAIYSKSLRELIDSTSGYYKLLDSSEIDKMATYYVMNAGLAPIDLSIKMPEGTVSEVPYKYSEIVVNKKARKAAIATPTPATGAKKGSSKGTAAVIGTFVNPDSIVSVYNTHRSGETDTKNSQARCAALTLVMQGDPAKAQKLLDDLMTKPSLRVTGFAWKNPDPVTVRKEDGTYETVIPEEKQLRVDINFYMAEYPEFEEEVKAKAAGGAQKTETMAKAG